MKGRLKPALPTSHPCERRIPYFFPVTTPVADPPPDEITRTDAGADGTPNVPVYFAFLALYASAPSAAGLPGLLLSYAVSVASGAPLLVASIVSCRRAAWYAALRTATVSAVGVAARIVMSTVSLALAPSSSVTVSVSVWSPTPSGTAGVAPPAMPVLPSLHW